MIIHVFYKIMTKPFCCGNGFCELYSKTIRCT